MELTQTWKYVEDTDITAWNIAGKMKTAHSNNISDSTRKQTEKRRQMKMDGAGIQNVEYTETCKIIGKKQTSI